MGGTPYWLILPFVVGWLAARHAKSEFASERSKRAVVFLSGGAFLLALAWSAALVPMSILLTAVGVYVVLHREISEHLAKAESEQLPRE